MSTTIIKKTGGLSRAAKITIGFVLLIGAGIGGWVWYEHSKKGKALKPADPKNEPGITPATTTPATTNSTPSYSDNSSPATSTTTSYTAPSMSSLPNDVKKFQDWMDSKHPGWLNDGSSLNKSTSKGYGTGGSQTKKAYVKYGKEYETVINPTLTLKDLNAFLKAGQNAIGKTVYSKYAGADVFDGVVADSVFNKLAKTTKAQPMGRVAKIIPSANNYWIVFSGATGKYYKMYASNLNVLA